MKKEAIAERLEGIKSPENSKLLRKRIMFTVIFAAVISIGTIVLLGSFPSESIDSKGGQNNEDTVPDIPDEASYWMSCNVQNYIRDTSLSILLKGNTSEVLNNINIYDKEDNLLDKEEVAFNQSIFPSLMLYDGKDYYGNNISIEKRSITLNCLFDLYNYSYFSDLSYSLNFSISTHYSQNYNLLVKNGEKNLIEDIFNGNISHSLNGLTPNEYVEDYEIQISAFDSARFNISAMLTISNKTDFLKYYLVKSPFQVDGLSDLSVVAEFTEEININGQQRNSITFNSDPYICSITPEISYNVEYQNITLTEISGTDLTIILFTDNEDYNRIFINGKGEIRVPDDVESFNGMLVVFDKAGNLETIPISYTKSTQPVPEEVHELQEKNKSEQGILLIAMIAAVVLFGGLIVLTYFGGKGLKSKYNSQRLVDLRTQISSIKEKIRFQSLSNLREEEKTLYFVKSEKDKKWFLLLNSSTITILLLGVSLFQTFISGLLIIFFERMNLLQIYVVEFPSVIYPAESIFIFFLIFLFSDCLSVFIAYKAESNSLLIQNIFISIIQVIIFITCLEFLANIRIFEIHVYTKYNSINGLITFLFFFFVIFISECVISLIVNKDLLKRFLLPVR